jgi:hypothetical protein
MQLVNALSPVLLELRVGTKRLDLGAHFEQGFREECKAYSGSFVAQSQ